MRRLALLGLGLVALAVPAGGSATVPRHYTFTFRVAQKPSSVNKLAAVKVTGSGSGSFTLDERRTDRDQTVYWTLKDVHGTVSFASGGKTFVGATVVDGTYGVDDVYGKVTRNALLRLRMTSSTKFHCKPPDATLGLRDGPAADDLSFYVCAPPNGCTTCVPSLGWQGKAPTLVVTVKPA